MNRNKAAVVIDGSHVSINDIVAVARYGVPVQVSRSAKFVKKMEKTQNILMDSMRKGIPVYGVTTGYGKSCGKAWPPASLQCR
jgi:histidine ammonia-lyase